MSENSNRLISSAELGSLLEDSGALLKGHFVLSSGRHSDIYIEKFRLFNRPDVLSALCTQLKEELKGMEFDVVAGPVTAGIIMAFEMGRQLGIEALYVESSDGIKTLRRGQTIQPDAKVLVVDDVLTTGLSIRETIAVVRRFSGKVEAVGTLIDRTEKPVDFGVPAVSAFKVEAKSWPADQLPDELAAIPAKKPGTRS